MPDISGDKSGHIYFCFVNVLPILIFMCKKCIILKNAFFNYVCINLFFYLESKMQKKQSIIHSCNNNLLLFNIIFIVLVPVT